MEDIKGALSKITKTITKTSGDVVKTTKLNINLANEEEKLKALYMDIGKKVHEIYAYGGSLGEFFDNKYNEILNVKKSIDRLKSEIDTVKGTKTCANCGKSISRNSEFCPKCGARMDNSFENIQNDEINPEFKNKQQFENIQSKNENLPKVKICTVCKCKNKIDDKFCISCGRIL